jgi:hypothetical protein
MEKLRIFFIYAWAWTNRRLYRSAMISEGLMHFLGVQASVTHQFSGEKQHGDLVAIAPGRCGVGIHVEHLDLEGANFRQRSEFALHFLAQPAPRARIQYEAWRARAHRSMAREFGGTGGFD